MTGAGLVPAFVSSVTTGVSEYPVVLVPPCSAAIAPPLRGLVVERAGLDTCRFEDEGSDALSPVLLVAAGRQTSAFVATPLRPPASPWLVATAGFEPATPPLGPAFSFR